jgi:hypothetical protein
VRELECGTPDYVASLAFHSRCDFTRKLPDECTAPCHRGAPAECAYEARFFLLLRFFLPARFFPALFLPAFLDARFFPAFLAATRFPFSIAQEIFLRVYSCTRHMRRSLEWLCHERRLSNFSAGRQQSAQ